MQVQPTKTGNETETETISKPQWKIYIRNLLILNVTWNVIEGVLSLYFGIQSNNLSVIAFGIVSCIEILSASLILYHILKYNANNAKEQTTLFTTEIERQLTLFIGILLICFGIFAIIGSIFRIIYKEIPDNSLSGILISITALFIMIYIWIYKTKGT